MVCCGRSHAIILKGGSTFGCTFWSKLKDYLILRSNILKFNLNTPLSIVIFLPRGKFSKEFIHAHSQILKFLLATCSPGSFMGCRVGGRQTQLSSCQSDTPFQTFDTSGIQPMCHTLSSRGLEELSAPTSCPPPNPRGYHILAVMPHTLAALCQHQKESAGMCTHGQERCRARIFFFKGKGRIVVQIITPPHDLVGIFLRF